MRFLTWRTNMPLKMVNMVMLNIALADRRVPPSSSDTPPLPLIMLKNSNTSCCSRRHTITQLTAVAWICLEILDLLYA